jgi:hypothetical protein
MSGQAWELVFMMLILKIPIVYLCLVVYWAVKAEPEPPEHAVVREPVPEPTPGPRPSPLAHRRRRPHPRPHGSPTRRYARPGRSVQPV